MAPPGPSAVLSGVSGGQAVKTSDQRGREDWNLGGPRWIKGGELGRPSDSSSLLGALARSLPRARPLSLGSLRFSDLPQRLRFDHCDVCSQAWVLASIFSGLSSV